VNPCSTDVWCDVGINGMAFIGQTSDSQGTLNSSVSGSKSFYALGGEPCYLGLYNYQHLGGIDFEISGGSVDANLVSIKYPNEIKHIGQKRSFTLEKD